MTQHVAQLFEGNMLVRLMPLQQPFPTIQTPRLAPPRLADLDPMPPEPESILQVDTWVRSGHSVGEDNWMTAEYWIHVFGTNPPELTQDGTFRVPVQWWKYVRS